MDELKCLGPLASRACSLRLIRDLAGDIQQVKSYLRLECLNVEYHLSCYRTFKQVLTVLAGAEKLRGKIAAMLRSSGESPDIIEKMITYVWTLLIPSLGEDELMSTIPEVTQSKHIEGASQSRAAKESL